MAKGQCPKDGEINKDNQSNESINEEIEEENVVYSTIMYNLTIIKEVQYL